LTEAFLGIDGGGTRTRAVVLDSRGMELARVDGPPTLVDASDPQPSIDAAIEICQMAAAVVHHKLPLSGLWAGIAGAASEPIRTTVEDAIRETGIASSVAVGSDAHAAYFDAFGDGSGILLVSGTGSGAVGRGEDGRWVRCGGWGLLLGDEGSGYALGLSGLRGVARGWDGRGPKTILESRLVRACGLERPQELIAWVASAPKREIAGLSPVICQAAEDGDDLAQALIETAVEDLVGHVLTVMRRLGPWHCRPHVALAGGLINEDRPLRMRVKSALSGLVCSPIGRPVDAARGAARMAIRLAGD
jgi:N-acetylglucosamine kinase-like BadF-type ATPase